MTLNKKQMLLLQIPKTKQNRKLSRRKNQTLMQGSLRKAGRATPHRQDQKMEAKEKQVATEDQLRPSQNRVAELADQGLDVPAPHPPAVVPVRQEAEVAEQKEDKFIFNLQLTF